MHSIPALNTIILVGSSFWFTIALRSFNFGFYKLAKLSLYITGSLGAFFTSIQIYEYSISLISICDSIYGSVFFFSTGFHGIHVIIGVLSIGYFCTLNEYFYINFSKNHNKLLRFIGLY
jgi:heme/copper-type cytochrome/quinol oxidase subunit 3